jgi:hypothetical protein
MRGHTALPYGKNFQWMLQVIITAKKEASTAKKSTKYS